MAPPLSQLLEVQKLDLASDKLIVRRRELPERAQLEDCRARGRDLDADHAVLLERREALSRAEHELEAEVQGVADKAQQAEDSLYSGSVTAPKELEAQQEEVRLLRARQGGLEEREMELLEEIEALEREMSENRSAREQSDARAAELQVAIDKAESEIDAELARLAGERAPQIAGVPAPVLEEYERLRAKPKLGGRVAAQLGDGRCDGCGIKLPVLEYKRMREQPEDAVIRCVSCGRVLVR